jgi:hypothetical protein
VWVALALWLCVAWHWLGEGQQVLKCAAAARLRYLVLFLKFIASVVPTIQYDYTMPVGGPA